MREHFVILIRRQRNRNGIKIFIFICLKIDPKTNCFLRKLPIKVKNVSLTCLWD
jgi:hypothetical protein